MRLGLVASLAWQDYRNDAWLSACAVLALVAVVAPLLVLFGLKFRAGQQSDRTPGERPGHP